MEIIFIILICLGILFILAIPAFGLWLFFAYRSYKRGTLKRFLVCTSIIAVILGIQVYMGYFWLSAFYDAHTTQQITGKWFYTGRAIGEFHSPRSFTGDGYSIMIYTLPESAVRHFANPDEDFRNHPCPPWGFPEDCCVVKWKTGIPETDEQKFLDHALLHPQRYLYSFLKGKKISELLLTAKNSLYKGTTHYSYVYRIYDDDVSDIHFFIIDPVGKLLIIINHST